MSRPPHKPVHRKAAIDECPGDLVQNRAVSRSRVRWLRNGPRVLGRNGAAEGRRQVLQDALVAVVNLVPQHLEVESSTADAWISEGLRPTGASNARENLRHSIEAFPHDTAPCGRQRRRLRMPWSSTNPEQRPQGSEDQPRKPLGMHRELARRCQLPRNRRWHRVERADVDHAGSKVRVPATRT